MLGKPFFGRQFFTPESDGGAGGGSAGDDEGDGNEAGDGQTDRDHQGDPDRSGDDQKTGEDVSGLKSALQTERRTNAAIKDFARTRNITFAQAIAQFTQAEDANKTELQWAAEERDLARQRADDTEQRLRLANARSAVTDATSKANAISGNVVFAIVWNPGRSISASYGSPPRPWGRLSVPIPSGRMERFTPTPVGTAIAIKAIATSSSVHPHARGDGC